MALFRDQLIEKMPCPERFQPAAARRGCRFVAWHEGAETTHEPTFHRKKKCAVEAAIDHNDQTGGQSLVLDMAKIDSGTEEYVVDST